MSSYHLSQTDGAVSCYLASRVCLFNLLVETNELISHAIFLHFEPRFSILYCTLDLAFLAAFTEIKIDLMEFLSFSQILKHVTETRAR